MLFPRKIIDNEKGTYLFQIKIFFRCLCEAYYENGICKYIKTFYFGKKSKEIIDTFDKGLIKNFTLFDTKGNILVKRSSVTPLDYIISNFKNNICIDKSTFSNGKYRFLRLFMSLVI